MNRAANTNSSAPAMEMRNVAVSTRGDVDTVAVESVNWTVAPGDFWIVGGLQGAGKSDFLLTAGGLTGPTEGTYRFFGEEMPIFEDHRLPERLRLGFVFDGGQLFNRLTVAENVALPLRYHHNLAHAQANAEAQRMLELTGLTSWADSTPGAIGRNWRKRVGLARALMLKPDVLLLDNPLAGLDLRHCSWWVKFLGELSRGHEWRDGRPMTLVVTADDLRPWRQCARQFAALKDKHFLVLGSWEQIEVASDELVRELMGLAQENA
jgi:ABC-type transporter Mla maintaining outer membrane lipid asymmetry ATPase subunit MlaF